MEEIKDKKGKLICKGDPTTGTIESVYKGFRSSTNLPVGGSFTIEKEDTLTIITRTTAERFDVKRYES